MVRPLLRLLLILSMLLIAACRATPPARNAADGGAPTGQLVGEVRKSVDEPMTPAEFLDAAERSLALVQEDVPRLFRVQGQRLRKDLLIVEFDLLAEARFTAPVAHAMTGGIPLRLELAASRGEMLETHWRMYSLRHEFPPESRLLTEEMVAMMVDMVVRTGRN